MRVFIKSDNPIKKQVVAIFKKLANADKVTNVYQVGENTFQANTFAYAGNRQYTHLGTYQVVLANLEAGVITSSSRVDVVESSEQNEEDNTTSQDQAQAAI